MLSESDESDAHARDAAARAAPPATTIAALPHALLARVFACLPVDARLRCCEVCRGWRHVLATEHSLWTALDLSETSGAMEYVTDALLRAAAAKASGALETLDVSGCDGISHEALLEVVTVNAASLLEMRAAGTEDRTCKKITTLLRAAPWLRLLATDVACNAGDAARMLRNEDVFLPLRVQDLHVSAREADAAALHALAAALAALASPLKFFRMDDAHLGAVDVLDAVVDAALANRLVDVLFFGCALSAASAPSLARLLSGGALTSLRISQNEQLLDAPAAVLLGGALQTKSVLQRLQLKGMNFWRDLSATKTLLSSLVAHPSLRELDLSGDDFARWHAACAGAALFALVAANTPALTELDVSWSYLSDARLRPLFDALPRNTHLRTLYCGGGLMSEAFARVVLLPAVRANTSLTHLWTGKRHAGAAEAEAIVLRRAAEAS
jgi:hypothetical protein